MLAAFRFPYTTNARQPLPNAEDGSYLGRHELAHVPPEPKARVTSDAAVERQVDKRVEAQAKGFTGNVCSNCDSLEMVRSGTCERCGQRRHRGDPQAYLALRQ